MPSEERFITFSFEEVFKALVIMSVKEDTPKPPDGKVTSVTIEESGRVAIKIDCDNGEDEEIVFEQRFFALSLVFFCQGCGIPLPKGGTKTLMFSEDKIVMRIVLK